MNKELKQLFIQEKKEDNINADSFIVKFDKLEEYEDLVKKDGSQFTIDDICGYYSYLNTSSLQSLIALNSLFIEYTDWMIKKGLVPTNQNQYRFITTKLMQACVNEHILSSQILNRDELITLINQLTRYSDKYIWWAYWEGLMFEDIITLSLENFLSPTELKLDKRVIDVDEMFYDIAKHAWAENSYTLVDERTVNVYGDGCFKLSAQSLSSCTLLEEIPTGQGYIKLTIPNDIKISPSVKAVCLDQKTLVKIRRGIVNRIRMINQQMDINISSNRLHQSGLISYIKSFHKNDETWMDTISNINDKIENKYGHIQSRKNFLIKYECFLDA